MESSGVDTTPTGERDVESGARRGFGWPVTRRDLTHLACPPLPPATKGGNSLKLTSGRNGVDSQGS